MAMYRKLGRQFATGVALLGIMAPGAAGAAAWTRDQGKLLFVLPTEYSFATEQFDGDGERIDRRRFESVEIGPYLEYGLTDYLTLGAQPKYRRVTLETASGTETNAGFAESDALARLRLWSADEAALSIQGLVKIPIDPKEEDPAALGFDQYDVEGSVLYGDRFLLGDGKFFYDLDAGYRKRFDTPADELHGDAFAGWWTGGALTFVVHAKNTIGLDNEDLDTVEALTAEPNFRRHQAQASVSYRLTDTLSLVAGGSTTYAGTNVGAGYSVFGALVANLDPGSWLEIGQDY